MTRKVGAMRAVEIAEERQRRAALEQSELDFSLVQKYIDENPGLAISKRFMANAQEVSALKAKLRVGIQNLRKLERAIVLVAEHRYSDPFSKTA